MLERQIDDYFEFHVQTVTAASGADTDPDAPPTFRVYEENNNTVVSSGTCSKRDDANTVGYYYARGEITTDLGYEVGKIYIVRGTGVVGGDSGSKIVGMFIVVPADSARDDQWTDARAGNVDELAAANIPADLTALDVLLDRVLGLAGENTQTDTVVTDANGRMTSGRLRIYSVAASVGTDDDVVATYTLTATYTGNEIAPATYKMVKA